MSAARRALWYIESHHAENLTLADIARAVQLSPFHLSRLFQAGTGTSVVRYLRGRRLSEAARRLAAGAGDILEVALGAGYASHASFTRAFADQFGRTPERVREQGLHGLALVEPLRLQDSAAPCAVEARPRPGRALRIAGIGARHTPATVAGIPAQWQQLALARPACGGIRYGVCCHGDDSGGFDYIAGIEVGAAAPLPAGWQAVDIPARPYLVAWHDGHIAAIRSTWYWLLNVYLPGAGLSLADAPDMERYDARFDDTTGLGGVEIWLPLAGPSPCKETA
ncbi:AraC family transcriptional regulator [Stenotrophomonas rhizophila]|uniref:AraC family transcriptional regulator n=1 Tax=Stenotrophomonas rhizophila TaxID=216778 RepID=UPI001E32A61C|nr:AraC family transcriptional regulator [Stenotrophomonas rhizophila]MCC7633767.1 AraC family transcriptional regulator [Stenotrophomonas rhizophila]MCC7663713.1 AraC family transcriptional regulator [Stenotrophomonas rhizophila]